MLTALEAREKHLILTSSTFVVSSAGGKVMRSDHELMVVSYMYS